MWSKKKDKPKTFVIYIFDCSFSYLSNIFNKFFLKLFSFVVSGFYLSNGNYKRK